MLVVERAIGVHDNDLVRACELGSRLSGQSVRVATSLWCTQAPTPHLASPLRGGRDELGRGVAMSAKRRFVALAVEWVVGVRDNELVRACELPPPT